MSIEPDRKKLKKIGRLLKEFCDKHGLAINATAYGTHSGIAVADKGNFYDGCYLDFEYAPGEEATLDGIVI